MKMPKISLFSGPAANINGIYFAHAATVKTPTLPAARMPSLEATASRHCTFTSQLPHWSTPLTAKNKRLIFISQRKTMEKAKNKIFLIFGTKKATKNLMPSKIRPQKIRIIFG
jgi:hypothetical protein